MCSNMLCHAKKALVIIWAMLFSIEDKPADNEVAVRKSWNGSVVSRTRGKSHMMLPEVCLKTKFVLMVIIMLNGLAMAQRVDCKGIVLDTDRQPVKNATVSIYTAKVKTGTSPYCPSCYADCRKRVRTDEMGRFALLALDPELLFKILIVAQDYCPRFVDDVDPGKSPINVVLSPLAPERLVPSHVMRGRVVGSDGSPVAGATVSPIAKALAKTIMSRRITRRDPNEFDPLAATNEQVGTMMFPVPCTPNEVDPLAVTNEQGEFLLTAKAPDLTLWVTIRARGLAPCHYRSLSAGSTIHEIRLSRGCSVNGSVVQGDIPMEEGMIGIVQEGRRLGVFFGEYTTGLRKNGFFRINNLPPDTDFYVYGKMESFQGRGAVSVRQFRTGGDGSDVDVGELTLERGHKLTGRIILSDGESIPYKTRLLISRTDAWDTLICELDKEGRFNAYNLPSGEYNIHVYVKGYRISSKNNASPDKFSLKGTINRDIDDLMVLLEPDRTISKPKSSQ
ncbi:MAG: hypothetical protein FVQ84_04310 [Planctomycetes bacterium]|nr:hypothetical protein [Planctomycetota bacterium]